MYCAQRSDAIDYFDADFNQPIVLAIGGELRGLSRDVLEQSDQNIVIPYARPVRSALNGTSAVAAISFEVVRQRPLIPTWWKRNGQNRQEQAGLFWSPTFFAIL